MVGSIHGFNGIDAAAWSAVLWFSGLQSPFTYAWRDLPPSLLSSLSFSGMPPAGPSFALGYTSLFFVTARGAGPMALSAMTYHAM